MSWPTCYPSLFLSLSVTSYRIVWPIYLLLTHWIWCWFLFVTWIETSGAFNFFFLGHCLFATSSASPLFSRPLLLSCFSLNYYFFFVVVSDVHYHFFYDRLRLHRLFCLPRHTTSLLVPSYNFADTLCVSITPQQKLSGLLQSSLSVELLLQFLWVSARRQFLPIQPRFLSCSCSFFWVLCPLVCILASYAISVLSC